MGAITVARQLAPQLAVWGVQAERASAIHDSWHARKPMPRATADTFADGLATRNVYELTFDALCEGLRGFVAAMPQARAFRRRRCSGRLTAGEPAG